jgi:hypothetical protein
MTHRNNTPLATIPFKVLLSKETPVTSGEILPETWNQRSIKIQGLNGTIGAMVGGKFIRAVRLGQV